MKHRHVSAALLLAALCSPPALAGPPPEEHWHAGGETQKPGQGREWTRHPLIVAAMRGGDAERMAARLNLRNIEAQRLTVHSPAGGLGLDFPVTGQGARIEAPDPKIGNFHWVSARQEKEGMVVVASTTHAFSNPGPAPTALLLERKHELEIIPQPLPREHASYREGEKWQFLVRFDGRPLAGKRLDLETEFGTRTAATTGPDGLATVLLPLDFKPATESEGHGRRQAKFVLAVEHESQGRRYLTAFNSSYAADPYRKRNLAAGAGFGLLGMLLAAPLWRRKERA